MSQPVRILLWDDVNLTYRIATGSVGAEASVEVVNTVAMSAASLPLPTGAATESTISDVKANQTNGSQIVKGNVTPSDNHANPTTTVDTNSHLVGYNPTTGTWYRISTRQFGTDDLAGLTDNGIVVDARLRWFDGTSLDRARGDTANGLDVDVTRVPYDVVIHESNKSARVASGHMPTLNVHFDAQNASGTVGYMLIDLSNTTAWKHTNTGHIVLEKIIVNVNPTTAYLGDIEIGFLSSVDATDGNFNKIIVVHGERSSNSSTETYDFTSMGLDLKTTNWFGPVTANDTTWQADVNLYGPDGATSYPSGNGDLVMKLISTAGSIDIGVTAVYTTEA